MNYRIYWKNQDNGRQGTGTKAFTKEEAEALAQELNADYPGIDHVAIDVVTAGNNVVPMEDQS